MMEKILNSILSITEVRIENEIVPFSCKLNAPISLSSIKELEEKRKIVFPNDLKEFLLLSNGAQFFGSADYDIFSLEEIDNIIKTNQFNKNVYVIASILEDYIVINMDEIETNDYLYFCSSICPDECIKLGYNFTTFLNNFIKVGFNNYWTISYDDIELVDFSWSR